MNSQFILISDFGSDFSVAHNNLWTIEYLKEKSGVRGTIDNNAEFVFDDWVKIADFDSFISLNGKHESQIVQNAIEQGQFRSANKIRKPNVFVVELAKGGLAENIQLVLDNLIAYKESTQLLRVRTPFGMIENVNLIGLEYSFKRGDCASMLVAKLHLQEVQSGKATMEYSIEKTKNPENTNTVDAGTKNSEVCEDVVKKQIDKYNESGDE